MKKTIFVLITSFILLFLTACFSLNDITSISVNKAPDAYVALNEKIRADQFTVNIEANGVKYENKSISDSMLTVYGLVEESGVKYLDTSSVGKKTVTVVYDSASVKISYFVADSLVYNYTDFTEAMVSVEGIIVLMSDIQVSVSNGVVIPAGHTKTFELNGHSLSFTAEAVGTTALITNYGTLTIQDSTDIERNGSGTGKVTGFAVSPDMQEIPSYASNTITNNGTLIVNSGTIENTTASGASFAIDNNSGTSKATLTINGGKVFKPVSAGSTVVRLFANSTTNENIVNVTGGVIEGRRPIWIQLPGSNGQLKKAEVNISGGTLISTDSVYNFVILSSSFGDSFAATNITITNGVFEGDVALYIDYSSYGDGGGITPPAVENVSITGGQFNGVYGAFSYNEEMPPFITGGTFKADPTNYVNTTTHYVTLSNGNYIVTAK